MTTATKPLHLNRLEISNFLRVTALKVDADGKHVVLRGQNGSGKTSAVLAIWEALKGHSSKAVPEPVRHGAEEASITADLGEYLVERRFDDKGTSLIVTAADGSKVRRAQELLDGLLGKFSLDPVSFLGLRPIEQIDTVLQAAGVAPPVDEVETITTERHEALPSESAAAFLERLSADQTGVYYVRRRDAHRVVEQKRAALEEQRAALHRAGGPIQPNEAAQTATGLLRERSELQLRADERREAAAKVAEFKSELVTNTDTLRDLKTNLTIEAKRIAELEQQLVERRRAHADLENRITNGAKVLEEIDADRKAAEAALAKLSDPAPLIGEIDRKIQTVEADSKARMRREVLEKQVNGLAVEHERADGDHKTLDGIMDGLRGLRSNLLNGVNLGVDGLEVGLGELRLGGVPFRQASQAEQLRTACAVAMAQNPRLKLLRVDGGEQLDRHSRELLFGLADEHGWQVVMTSVADDEELRVEIMEAG